MTPSIDSERANAATAGRVNMDPARPDTRGDGRAGGAEKSWSLASVALGLVAVAIMVGALLIVLNSVYAVAPR